MRRRDTERTERDTESGVTEAGERRGWGKRKEKSLGGKRKRTRQEEPLAS